MMTQEFLRGTRAPGRSGTGTLASDVDALYHDRDFGHIARAKLDVRNLLNQCLVLTEPEDGVPPI